MKKVILGVALVIAISSCDQNSGHVYVNNSPNVVVTPEATNLGDNLDLQALGELVKSSSSAQEIENKLNTSGSINNLDLDGDGSVDYIKVTEYGSDSNKGFSFTVDLAGGEKQEIASVDLEKNNDGANMNIQGNQQIYGSSAYYQSHYSLSDLMIMHYLFSYHRPYYSPYHYGYYPSYYHSYRSVPVRSYRSHVTTTTRTSRITRTTTSNSKIKSPNSSLSSKKVSNRVQSLSSPSRSQKSFQRTNTSNNRPSTTGFGNKNRSSSYSGSSSSSSSKSFGSSSRSRGSSGFGGSSRSGRRR